MIDTNLGLKTNFSNKDSFIVLFLTFCGLMMVAYSSIIGGGFMAGYWLQGGNIQLEITSLCSDQLSDNDRVDRFSKASTDVNIAMYSILAVQNIFYVPTNAFLLYHWYRHEKFKASLNKFIWIQR